MMKELMRYRKLQYVPHPQKGMDVEKRQVESNRWKNYLDIEGRECNHYVENVEVNRHQNEDDFI